MAGEIKVEIGCNYEDFLRGLATVKKEADLAVLDQRRKDKEASNARRAAARAEQAERKTAEREKQDAAKKENKDATAAFRETQRQLSEKQKAERDAQKASQTSREQKIGIAQGFLSGGLTGAISAIGSTFGPEGMLIAEAVNKLIEGFQKALHLQNISIATGLSVKELSGLELLSTNLGTSIEALARSFGEFNRKVGEARIKGSELNNLFNKLNVSQEELSNGSMTAQRGMILLARAHKAGTDAATLAYYGNMMFGSSFNDLLPAIKSGETAISGMSDVMYNKSEMLNKQSSQSASDLNNLSESVKNFMSDAIGAMAMVFNYFVQMLNRIEARVKISFGYSPETVAKDISKGMGKAGTDADKREFLKETANDLYEDDPKHKARFLEESERLLGQAGTKLTPLGMQTAQGASTLQQMAGGDIVSAIAFNPAEKTAENTARLVEIADKHLEEAKASNQKSNLPKGTLYRSK